MSSRCRVLALTLLISGAAGPLATASTPGTDCDSLMKPPLLATSLKGAAEAETIAAADAAFKLTSLDILVPVSELQQFEMFVNVRAKAIENYNKDPKSRERIEQADVQIDKVAKAIISHPGNKEIFDMTKIYERLVNEFSFRHFYTEGLPLKIRLLDLVVQTSQATLTSGKISYKDRSDAERAVMAYSEAKNDRIRLENVKGSALANYDRQKLEERKRFLHEQRVSIYDRFLSAAKLPNIVEALIGDLLDKSLSPDISRSDVSDQVDTLESRLNEGVSTRWYLGSIPNFIAALKNGSLSFDDKYNHIRKIVIYENESQFIPTEAHNALDQMNSEIQLIDKIIRYSK